jgi:hypothetical protein
LAPFRISPSWLFVLPAILGAALERGANSAHRPVPSARLRRSPAAYVLTDSALIEALIPWH